MLLNLNVTFIKNSTAVPNYFEMPPASMVAIYAILFVITETLGNFLLICTAVYEKYGMDPQKRTVSNQLLNNNCIVWMFHNIFVLPFFAAQQIFGSDSKFSEVSDCTLILIGKSM